MELVDEDTEGRERPQIKNCIIPRPHRIGRTMDEHRHVDDLQNNMRKESDELRCV